MEFSVSNLESSLYMVSLGCTMHTFQASDLVNVLPERSDMLGNVERKRYDSSKGKLPILSYLVGSQIVHVELRDWPIKVKLPTSSCGGPSRR